MLSTFIDAGAPAEQERQKFQGGLHSTGGRQIMDKINKLNICYVTC